MCFFLLQISYMFPLSSLNDPLMITHRFFPGNRALKNRPSQHNRARTKNQNLLYLAHPFVKNWEQGKFHQFTERITKFRQ